MWAGTDTAAATPQRPEPTEPVRRLGRSGLAWRATLLLAGVLLTCYGTLFGSDDLWPFAPMSQFAFYVAPDSRIWSTYLDGATADGQVVNVRLDAADVGAARAEIEGQLDSFQRDPDKLQDLADAYHRLHPDRPPYTQLWLRQQITQLHRGRTVGVRVITLASWRASNDR